MDALLRPAGRVVHRPGAGDERLRPVRADDGGPVARDLAILTLQLLDHFGDEPVHLLGLGLGGWVAAEMATMAQRRLSSLVLVGAAGIKPTVGDIHDPMNAGWIDYARLGFSSDERFLSEIGDEPPEDLIDLWDYSREMTARVTWRPWMWSAQLPALLRGVRVPSLVVWGDQDRIMPLDCGEQYAELLGSRLEVLPGGHTLDLETPGALADLVSTFVSQQRS